MAVSLKQLIKNIFYKSSLDIFIAEGGIIGTGCKVSPSVFFGSEPYLITIGNNVQITDGVRFLTHDGGLWTLRKTGLLENADYFGRIFVGDNCHIGWNTIIMPNVNIGKNCIIGCGAIVTKDIPDNSVAVGIPAHVIKTITEYYDKHKDICVFTKSMTKSDKKKFLKEKFNL
jgi:acetyltransferase-like isoleucine patch superfamily enzyme